MELRFSVMAKDRLFMKAMRRVRERLQPLCDEFQRVSLTDPIHEAILVGITDDQPAEFFEEVENNDGFFQVMAGCRFNGDDRQLVTDVFKVLYRAAMACPFSKPDREKFNDLFERFEPTVLTVS